MSCYVCEEKHIALLAIYYAENIVKVDNDAMEKLSISSANILMDMNIASVAERYGGKTNQTRIEKSILEFIVKEVLDSGSECHPMLLDSANPSRIFMSADCLSYQCDGLTYYKSSEASSILDSIRQYTLDLSPYDEADELRKDMRSTADIWGEYNDSSDDISTPSM